MVENRRKKGSIPHSRRRQGVPDSMMETTPEEKKTRKSNQQPRPEQKQQNNQGDEEEFIPIASDDNEMEMDMSSQTLTGNNNISASAASSDSSVSTPEKSQQLKSLSKEDGVVGKASFDWFAEEEDDEDEDGEEVTLPALDDESSVTVNSTSIPKIDTEMDRKIRQKMSDAKLVGDRENEIPGVVYIGRIPHGFYENEMRGYFSQFGKVLRLRISRNKRTGKSKHYGFIEFASRKVAEIVCDTMHNYLMNGRLLQCKLMDDERVHPELFKGSGKKFRVLKMNPRDPMVLEKRAQAAAAELGFDMSEIMEKRKRDRGVRLLKKEEAKRARLLELGIDYDFPGYSDKKQ